jgi:hypothetical protein
MTAGNAPDEHVFDDLPALLAGELNRAETNRVSDHLRGCDDCRQDLVLAVSASAALRSAVRFAPQAVQADGGLPPPRFLAELAAGGAGPDTGPIGSPDPRGGPSPGTDPAGALDFPFDHALDSRLGPPAPGGPAGPGSPGDPAGLGDPAGPRSGRGGNGRGRHVQRSPRSRARWSAIAAGLLLVVGIGGGVVISRGGGQPAGQQIALNAVGPGSATGNASLNGDQVCVNRASLPPPPAGHSYEVWLVNQARSKLQAVGMTSNGQGCWTVPAAQVGDFTTIEISDEPDDGNAAYSGTSVLRGTYS